jgi:hypothetical protein
LEVAMAMAAQVERGAALCHPALPDQGPLTNGKLNDIIFPDKEGVVERNGRPGLAWRVEAVE